MHVSILTSKKTHIMDGLSNKTHVKLQEKTAMNAQWMCLSDENGGS